MFDVTRRETFNHLSRWLEEARQFANSNICITLVGNKADLSAKRIIQRHEAQAFADENGLDYVEVSAKTAERVDEAFLRTAETIWEKINSGGMGSKDLLDEKETLKLGASPTKGAPYGRKKCCS